MTNGQPGYRYNPASALAIDFTGEWINLANLGAHQISFIVYHGICTGTYAIEVTNDPRIAIDASYTTGVFDLTTYVADADLWIQPAGAARTDLIPLCGLPCGWVRLKYTHTEGDAMNGAMIITVSLPTRG